MKKVLLIIVDALASRVVRPAMEAGRLPHLQQLATVGRVDWDCTAIFPSITPAATAALITGEYPCATGISGAYFYDHKNDRVHYYGDDTWPIMRRGFATFFEDFLVKLNRDQLQTETTFELVERTGYKAASLNYLWFRGETPHRVTVPWVLRLWPGMPYSKTITGPSMLSLGDFVSAPITETGRNLKGPGGMFRRFGFNDEATAAELLLLAQEQAFPEFTVAYFPDNDFKSHTDGPQASLSCVEKVDRVIGELMSIYGGVDTLLESLAIIVTGDHAQCDLYDDQAQKGIQLDAILADFEIVPAGASWQKDDQLMICPNMRAAQLYLRKDYWTKRENIISLLLEDSRIDQIIWHESDAPSASRFRVQTQPYGLLEFGPIASEETTDYETAVDVYGTLWSWRGDLKCVDGRVNESGVLEFGDYPNAFERIVKVFGDAVSGDLWVTAQLGCEFCIDGIAIHHLGSHGSLHRDDSFSPLITAGIASEMLPHKAPRSVDVAPLCLNVLGLPSKRAVGQSHVSSLNPQATQKI